MNQSTDTQAQLNQALELHRAGRIPEAEALYASILARHPAQADAAHLLGVLLTQTGRAHLAIPHLRRSIRMAPDQAGFHASLGRAHHALGHVEDALPCMQRASELAPAAEHLCALGALFQEQGRLDEAARSYGKALGREPGHVTSRYNLATVSHERGDTRRAAELLQALVAEHPGVPGFRTALCGYLLELDRVEGALGHCDAALASNPRDLMAMTLKSVALLRLGRHDEAARLLDLDRLVVCRQIQAPRGYADLASFNAALCSHVRSHPSLVPDRRRNATRNGRHTDNLLLDENKGPMEALEGIFNEGVDAYLKSLPRDPGHPFLSRQPTRWRLQAWAVVMDSQGHQLAHTHPDGWVSGVYYASTPSVIRDDDDGHAGWIEFGRPLAPLIKSATALTRLLRPREGLLVLFPSYLYHETIAFEAQAKRISIAFDAVPA